MRKEYDFSKSANNPYVKMIERLLPPGWDLERLQRVLAHYENQTEDEAVAEDEAALEPKRPRKSSRLDYSKAKPNRFAARFPSGSRVVVLDPDIAKVFKSAKSVNDALRRLVKSSSKENGQPKKKKRTK